MNREEGRTRWKDLYRYWLDKHLDGKMPARCDIDPPLEIPQLLENLVLIEVCGDGLRYRVVGSAVSMLMSGNPTGTLVRAVEWRLPGVEAAWDALITSACRSQKPQLAIFSFPAADKRHVHCLVLPLINRKGQTAHLLAGVFCGGDIEHSRSIEVLEMREVVPPERQ